jgi:hypothetical protein
VDIAVALVEVRTQILTARSCMTSIVPALTEDANRLRAIVVAEEDERSFVPGLAFFVEWAAVPFAGVFRVEHLASDAVRAAAFGWKPEASVLLRASTCHDHRTLVNAGADPPLAALLRQQFDMAKYVALLRLGEDAPLSSVVAEAERLVGFSPATTGGACPDGSNRFALQQLKTALALQDIPMPDFPLCREQTALFTAAGLDSNKMAVPVGCYLGYEEEPVGCACPFWAPVYHSPTGSCVVHGSARFPITTIDEETGAIVPPSWPVGASQVISVSVGESVATVADDVFVLAIIPAIALSRSPQSARVPILWQSDHLAVYVEDEASVTTDTSEAIVGAVVDSSAIAFGRTGAGRVLVAGEPTTADTEAALDAVEASMELVDSTPGQVMAVVVRAERWTELVADATGTVRLGALLRAASGFSDAIAVRATSCAGSHPTMVGRTGGCVPADACSSHVYGRTMDSADCPTGDFVCCHFDPLSGMESFFRAPVPVADECGAPFDLSQIPEGIMTYRLANDLTTADRLLDVCEVGRFSEALEAASDLSQSNLDALASVLTGDGVSIAHPGWRSPSGLVAPTSTSEHLPVTEDLAVAGDAGTPSLDDGGVNLTRSLRVDDIFSSAQASLEELAFLHGALLEQGGENGAARADAFLNEEVTTVARKRGEGAVAAKRSSRTVAPRYPGPELMPEGNTWKYLDDNPAYKASLKEENVRRTALNEAWAQKKADLPYERAERKAAAQRKIWEAEEKAKQKAKDAAARRERWERENWMEIEEQKAKAQRAVAREEAKAAEALKSARQVELRAMERRAASAAASAAAARAPPTLVVAGEVLDATDLADCAQTGELQLGFTSIVSSVNIGGQRLSGNSLRAWCRQAAAKLLRQTNVETKVARGFVDASDSLLGVHCGKGGGWTKRAGGRSVCDVTLAMRAEAMAVTTRNAASRNVLRRALLAAASIPLHAVMAWLDVLFLVVIASKGVIESDTFACDLDWDVDCTATFLLGNSMHVTWDELHQDSTLAGQGGLLTSDASEAVTVLLCPTDVSQADALAGDSACFDLGYEGTLLANNPFAGDLLPAERRLASRGGADVVLAAAAGHTLAPSTLYKLVLRVGADASASSVPFLIKTIGCRANEAEVGVCAQQSSCEAVMGGSFVSNDAALVGCKSGPLSTGASPFGCCVGASAAYSSVLARGSDSDDGSSSSSAVVVAAVLASTCICCSCVLLLAAVAVAIRSGRLTRSGLSATPAAHAGHRSTKHAPLAVRHSRSGVRRTRSQSPSMRSAA